MCVSVDTASFRATVLVLTRTTHPVTGRTMHSLLYRNAPVNLADGGNAMLLHFPAAEKMDEGNILDTSSFAHCVDDIVSAIEPRGRARSSGPEIRSAEALVFEHGIYHVVLATDWRSIPAALEHVPADKKPALNHELFRWYGRFFPTYTFALCCFDNRQAALADPLLWWYYPQIENQLMLPAIDAHDGSPPDLEALVDTDHWVILGSHREIPGLHRVHYRNPIAETARPFLPTYVTGRSYATPTPNADFIAPLAALEQGNPSLIGRDLLPL